MQEGSDKIEDFEKMQLEKTKRQCRSRFNEAKTKNCIIERNSCLQKAGLKKTFNYPIHTEGLECNANTKGVASSTSIVNVVNKKYSKSKHFESLLKRVQMCKEIRSENEYETNDCMRLRITHVDFEC